MSRSFLNREVVPHSFLPQGLCTCSFICLEGYFLPFYPLLLLRYRIWFILYVLVLPWLSQGDLSGFANWFSTWRNIFIETLSLFLYLLLSLQLCWHLCDYLINVCLTCKLCESRDWHLYLQQLVETLAYSKCSINISQISDWIKFTKV